MRCIMRGVAGVAAGSIAADGAGEGISEVSERAPIVVAAGSGGIVAARVGIGAAEGVSSGANAPVARALNEPTSVHAPST